MNRSASKAILTAIILCCAPQLSFRNGSTALAQEPLATEQQSEKKAVELMMRSYSDAFGRGDLPAVVQRCSVPMLFILPQEVKLLTTPAEIEDFYDGILKGLRARGSLHNTVVEMHVKLLGRTVTLVSAVFLRHKTDGSDLEIISATYMLRKIEGAWKLVVLTPNPVPDVIQVE